MDEIPKVQRVVAVLWPSFLMSVVANVVFFSYFDPVHLLSTTPFAGAERMAVYTIAFFILWFVTASCSIFSCVLQRPCHEKKCQQIQ